VTAPAGDAAEFRLAAAWGRQEFIDSGITDGIEFMPPGTVLLVSDLRSIGQRLTCPKCSSPLIERFDGRDQFLACSDYAAGCRYTRPTPTEVPCPCSKPTCQHYSEPCTGSLSPRPGRWGDFLRCDRDDCRYTRSVAAKAVLSDEERRARQLSASAERSRRYRAKKALGPRTIEPQAESDQRIRDGIGEIRQKARRADISDEALAQLRLRVTGKVSSKSFDLADVQKVLSAVERYAAQKARHEDAREEPDLDYDEIPS
jgi:hypothetical protein